MASKKMAYRPKLFDDIASVLCFATGHYKCSKIWRALREIVPTCCGSASWYRLERAVAHNTPCIAKTTPENLPAAKREREKNQRLESHGFKIWSAKYLCQCWKVTIASWNALALEPRRWKAWTVILPLAKSHTKSLPRASMGQLAWYCPKHPSLVPILHRLHFLSSAMMLFSCFHVKFVHTMICVSLPVP